jgi:hypothetical protein
MTGLPDAVAIADVLADSLQVFDKLSPAVIDGLKRGIDPNRDLLIPVVLTPYGKLLDGNHRLQLLAAQGRTHIYRSKGEYVVDEDATPQNELKKAVGFQENRRNTTAQARAKAARRCMLEYGWNQSDVAEMFHVSRSAVSQWFRAEGLSTDGTVNTTDIKRQQAGEIAEPGAARTLADGLTAIAATFANLPPALTRAITVGPAGAIDPDPNTWDVAVPSGTNAEALADSLGNIADDLHSLQRLVCQAAGLPVPVRTVAAQPRTARPRKTR